MVREALEVGNKTLVTRRYELSPNLVQRWMKAYGRETVTHSSSAEVKVRKGKEIFYLLPNKASINIFNHLFQTNILKLT
ncbi:transposase-like protein [Anoxybacillus caldiproteolyticus]|uniref:Transposase-like protein n=1 Tax=Thermaerobacillus caldiproteolyticus TaxID=247480 RepID=A0A7V9Z8X4_9BACL|nr:transposase-like protein [Anoxybacillus caldiproteolyticus]